MTHGNKHNLNALLLVMGLALIASACGNDDAGDTDAGTDEGAAGNASGGDGDGDGDGEVTELVGRYINEFDGEEIISEDSWDFSYIVAEIVAVDNDANWVVTRTPDDADESSMPGTYSRLVYTDPEDGEFYYCTTDFFLETLDEALESTTEADPDDLDEGCFTFSWSKLTRVDE